MPRASEVCLDPELATPVAWCCANKATARFLGGEGEEAGVNSVSQLRELQSHSRRVWLQGKAENQGHFCSICHGNNTFCIYL